MSIRTMRFFMRQEEFTSATWRVKDRFDLSLILVRRGPSRLIECANQLDSLIMSDGSIADWIFLSSEKPELCRINPHDLRPSEWGWVDADVPREEQDMLLMGMISAKSDWYNADLGEINDNQLSLQIFQSVAPSFRRYLRRPVWAHNILHGGIASYRTIGYSAGALSWLRQGGQWGKEGVANIRYTVEGHSTNYSTS